MKVRREYFVPVNGAMRRVDGRELDRLVIKNRHLQPNSGALRRSRRYPQPPEACPKCGKTGRLDSHHDDYAKPYDVKWFCHACHMAHHAELRIQVCLSLGGEVREKPWKRADAEVPS